ncbi:hypothetical protein D3C75_730560 [compost metagenome]
MEHLGQHQGAVGVAGLRQFAITLDARIVGGHQHMGGVARTVVHTGHLQHDQPGTAFGTCPVVGDQLFIDQIVGGHRGVVTAGHDAVFQALATDFQGFEQVREGRCRGRHGAGTPGRLTCVGASLLAMDPRTPRGVRYPALSLTSIASKLAPTEAAGFVRCYYCAIEIYLQ